MSLHSGQFDAFEARHIGSSPAEINEMLSTVGYHTLDALINDTVPAGIRLHRPLSLPAPVSEKTFLKEFKEMMSRNLICKSFIGMGYYGTHTPSVIRRSILENQGWYTAYTPYQAEIAQGRLEMLLNFQTMVSDLTGLPLANASLLDEATAAAEAMAMFYATRPRTRSGANKLFVDAHVFPQTLALLHTRAQPLNIEVVSGDSGSFDPGDESYFAYIFQYPDALGNIPDRRELIKKCNEAGVKTGVCTDLLALTLLTSPGELGVDAAFGSAQRFGIPFGFGGPHAAFFAAKEDFKRFIPGRIIGVSKDSDGNRALRMALQTREQHIKRDKATSNICTSQVLLAVMSAAYAVYNGPERLKLMAEKINGLTGDLKAGLENLGVNVLNQSWFDTLTIQVENSSALRTCAEARSVNFAYSTGTVSISFDELTEAADVALVLEIFAEFLGKTPGHQASGAGTGTGIPAGLVRHSGFLTHPVFNSYHTEHEMLRYLKRLENKDLSMVHSMISLGSCTMKLNAATEMLPVTWPEVSNIHPFVPVNQAAGYYEMIEKLGSALCEITGFEAVSFQPNSGAQGEYAGLLAIRGFHLANGAGHRNVALIPSSAHGTNPASAVMVGMKVVVTACDDKGNIDVADLKTKIELHKENLACLMVTYPSTHGVFEETITEICELVHAAGGKVYMDGANMNAQVGLTSPARIGADVCHLNLHKTFCIPHGGGGPGMGPICVNKSLAPFLPGHPVVPIAGNAAGAVSAAPFGSASILVISYAYICMMGGAGLTHATQMAILNANYLKSILEKEIPVLYAGANGTCAHEFILDCRSLKLTAGIEVEDIAKRLMDYGFHAPTVSFPVPGTLMIEPTESESKAELDRFAQAFLSIREEIREIETGLADRENNIMKNAPHTAAMCMADVWEYPYSRQKAAFPLDYLQTGKIWPTVRRVDGAYGDRNLACTCAPIEEYA